MLLYNECDKKEQATDQVIVAFVEAATLVFRHTALVPIEYVSLVTLTALHAGPATLKVIRPIFPTQPGTGRHAGPVLRVLWARQGWRRMRQ